MKKIRLALLPIAALICAVILCACDVSAVLEKGVDTSDETAKAEEVITTEAPESIAEAAEKTDPDEEEERETEAETTAETTEAETTAAATEKVTSAEDPASAEREAFEKKVAAAMKPVVYVNENTIEDIFSTAVEIWQWFNMSTIPTSGEPVDDTFHYKVDYPHIKTYADLEKYVRNYFYSDIADQLLSYRSDYTDIDGSLCAIPADRGANILYGEIIGAELNLRSISFAEYTVEVQKYSFDEDGGDLVEDGSETFIFKLQMDKYGCWRFVSFPIWM
ncbi:MAG: hypothetical protein GX897_08385 [Clostridiales bacterium]|mgnify:CR=1 FL=1|jgi:hypothetical protein|nr:hypothetical protein [Clostridiales bacterium]